jgi:hypothetical protein
LTIDHFAYKIKPLKPLKIAFHQSEQEKVKEKNRHQPEGEAGGDSFPFLPRK